MRIKVLNENSAVTQWDLERKSERTIEEVVYAMIWMVIRQQGMEQVLLWGYLKL